MLDYYEKQPLEIIIYDPITHTIKNKKKPTFKGGAESLNIFDMDIAEIKKQTLKANSLSYKEVYLSDRLTNIGFYPVDTIVDLRYKLSIMTGIAVNRQHILYSKTYYNATSNPLHDYKSVYSIYRGTEYVPVNLVTDMSNKTNTIMGVPLDRELYNSRTDITVTCEDPDILLGCTIKSIVVIDLFTLLNPDGNYATKEKYEIDLLYYGFVYKYYPIMPIDEFIEIYKNKSRAISDIEVLKEKYSTQTTILNETIDNMSKIDKALKQITTRNPYYLTSAVARFEIPLLDFRSVIDRFVLNSTYVFIGTRLNLGIKQFNIYKVLTVYNNTLLFKPDKLQSNLVFIQTNGGVKIVIGKNFCDITIKFTDSTDTTYSKALNIIKKYYNDISDFITKMRNIIVIDKTVEIGDLSIISSGVQVSWPQNILSSDFIKMDTVLAEYERAGLIRVNSSESGLYNLSLMHGVVVVDHENIKNVTNRETNQYIYYNNSAYRESYNAYKYVDFQIIQRASDVGIVFKDISHCAFLNNYIYILNIIYSYIKRTADYSFTDNLTYTKKLKRLKAIDPELFDVKRYNPDAEVYSIKCQLSRQPVIYRANEIKNLGPRVKDRLTKFWNFTERKHVYYDCPNKMYSHLSFRPQSHPLGLCLPCCKKKIPGTDAVQSIIDQECMKDYSINAKKLQEILSKRRVDIHILSYGKEIDIDRESYAPHIFDKSFRLIGVAQELPTLNTAGLIYSILYCLKISIDEFVKELAGVITQESFKLINTGHLKMTLDHVKLKDLIVSLVSESLKFDIDFSAMNWTTVIMELVYLAFGINVIIVKDKDNTLHLNMIRSTELAIITEERLNEYIIVVGTDTGYYPMINKSETDNVMNKGIYVITDNPLPYFKRVLQSNINCVVNVCDLSIVNVITFTNKSSLYNITKLLRGNRGLIYAVIINDLIYIPIIYTEYLSDEYIIDDGFKEEYFLYDRNDLLKFLQLFSSELSYSLTPNYLVVNTDQKYIGFAVKLNKYKHSFMFHHKPELNPGVYKHIKVVKAPYNPISINKAIHMSKLTIPCRSNECAIQKKAQELLYATNIYNLFLIEFSSNVRSNKNEKVRKTLTGLLTERKIDKNKVRDVLIDHPSDINPIMELINNNPPFKVGSMFKHILYGFDLQLMAKLKKMKIDERINTIKKLLNPSIKIVSKRPKNISNIFISCEHDSEQPQCADKQLELLSRDYNICVQRLANELDNPYIYETVITHLIGSINKLIFIKRPTEILRIIEVKDS